MTVVVAAGIVMLPTIGTAAATPTLGGEVLTAGNPPTPGTTFSSSQVCLATGTGRPSDTFTFTADGTATLPIPGRFTETGSGTLSSGSANTFDATFTITDSTGTVVLATGTKTLAPGPSSAGCNPTITIPTPSQQLGFSAPFTYTVAFTAGGTETGTGQININPTCPFSPTPTCDTNNMTEGFGSGPTPPPPPPPPSAPPWIVSDNRLDTINTFADQVSAAASFDGLRAWQFRVGNTGKTPLNGAQVGISHTIPGIDLTSSAFGFSYANPTQGPAQPLPCNPPPTPPPTATSEICPPSPGATVSNVFPINTMDVNSSTGPQQGVPIPGATTGYDSSRALDPPVGSGSDRQFTLKIKLVDPGRYSILGNDNRIFVDTFQDNADSTPTLTAKDGTSVTTVLQCPQSGPPPAGTACWKQRELQTRMYPGPNPGDPPISCGSLRLDLDQAQLSTEYALQAQENQTTPPGCPSGMPSVRITALSSRTSPSPAPCTDNGTTCAVTMPDLTLGDVTFSVAAGQTGGFQTDQTPEYVLQFDRPPPPPPFPPIGTFVIGDGNAVKGNHVYFWGSQWAKNNSLSGGSAPNAFKGFESSFQPDLHKGCNGETWTADPGNSEKPPATVDVPSLMIVVVTSKATKSGSTISGNVTHLALIQVDPGYQPDPGHPGTGTVLRTCDIPAKP